MVFRAGIPAVRRVASTRTSVVRADHPRDAPIHRNPPGLPDSLPSAACGGRTDVRRRRLHFNLPVEHPGWRPAGRRNELPAAPSPSCRGLDNLGVILNYTYVESEIHYVTSTGRRSRRRPRTSPVSPRMHTTRPLYYENRQFRRASGVPRSATTTSLPCPDVTTTTWKAPTKLSRSIFRRPTSQRPASTFSVRGAQPHRRSDDQYVEFGRRPASSYHHFRSAVFPRCAISTTD